MSKMLKWMMILVWVCLMSTVSFVANANTSNAAGTKTYKFFSIQLLEGWSEYVPQKKLKNGNYIVVFTNATKDSAITITSSPKQVALTETQMIQEANKVLERLKKKNIRFLNANFDKQNGIFASAGVGLKDNQQWRVVMIQENNVLYTVLFNGSDIQSASHILNTLQANPSA